MRNRILCVTALTGVLVLASCGSSKATDKVFFMGTTMEITKATYGEYNYDMLSSGISELPVLKKTMEGNYEGVLFDVSTQDSISFTYTVKDGMCWSDGIPVTAEDLLFTLEYEDLSGSNNFTDTKTDGTVTKKKYESYELSMDKEALTLTLSSKNVRELSSMTTLRVAPMHVLKDNDNPTDEDLRVTSGPYVLSSFDSGSSTLKYVKNEHYPSSVNFDTIYCRIYSTEDSMYQALMDNTLDMVWNYSSGVSETYYDVLDENKNVTLMSKASENVPASLTFNNKTGIFADENLRNAVSYLLDYEMFRDTFGTKNASLSTRGFVPPSTVGYKSETKNSKNEKKAEEYLNASGYMKDSSGWYEKNGEILSFTLTVNSSKAAHVRYAELVKTCLEEEGIKVNLEELDSTAYNAKTSNKFSGGNITMEAAIYGYTAAGMGMGAGLASIYMDASHAVQGGAQVEDSSFKEILEGLNAARTLEEYDAYAGLLQDYYAAHSPAIALYWDSLTYAVSSELSGVGMDAVFGINTSSNWSTMKKN